MLPAELVTAVELGVKLTIVLVDSHGYKSIGSLSRSLGTGGFGTQRELALDLAANAESLGARVVRARTLDELRAALTGARDETRTTVIAVEVDPDEAVPGYESWWDVAVAEVSELESVGAARAAYETAKRDERSHV
jgi:3D-(3,5/4)-trihydroxycyclohexane-1,2-dione acylhydrolase (decyclizing)